jgi:hypothetical protein
VNQKDDNNKTGRKISQDLILRKIQDELDELFNYTKTGSNPQVFINRQSSNANPTNLTNAMSPPVKLNYHLSKPFIDYKRADP